MKYSMYLNYYVCKSPYPYYIVKADEELNKFYVSSNHKTFNAWLYNEQEVIAMIQEKYPNAERIAHVDRSKKIRTAKMTYKAKEGNERTYIKTLNVL